MSATNLEALAIELAERVMDEPWFYACVVEGEGLVLAVRGHVTGEPSHLALHGYRGVSVTVRRLREPRGKRGLTNAGGAPSVQERTEESEGD